MLRPFVQVPFLVCEGETVLVDADGGREHILPSYTTSRVAEIYARKVDIARAFGAATTVPKSMTRGVLRRGNRRGRRNPDLDPQILPLLLNSTYGKFAAPTSVEFAPVPYFLENPSYLFEDRQQQLFVLTLVAARLGKVPARWHVLSLAGADAIQVFTDWLLERVKAAYIEPFLALRISDVGPLLPTENGALFSPMYMPPAGDDPGVAWRSGSSPVVGRSTHFS